MPAVIIGQDGGCINSKVTIENAVFSVYQYNRRKNVYTLLWQREAINKTINDLNMQVTLPQGMYEVYFHVAVLDSSFTVKMFPVHTNLTAACTKGKYISLVNTNMPVECIKGLYLLHTM